MAQAKQSFNFELLDCTTPIAKFDDLIADPAKTFDFELDIFQKQAIIHLERQENVFVAAHTSAGKTVVAEYAIAMARRNATKVIYTAPIKALSNQKYRDFRIEFQDVGLITGDVQINESASCLVMTTEILLQMLYNSSNVIKELEWVIFDEVHYVNDAERGHVWEEVFIMLPDYVKLVLLSATVPNITEFADWLGMTRAKKTFVVSTYKRPVPLEHYLYTGSNAKTMNDIFKIVDKNGNFSKAKYQEAEAKKKLKSVGPVQRIQTVSYATERNIYINLIRYLKKEDKLPVICFTLSRKRCDENSFMIKNIETLDLNTAKESGRIHKIIEKHLAFLKEEDKKLPQIQNLVEMLKRGIGVHHSGVLPILKEITEILFCDGHVKVLFATETFAMGINMPARTVVFDSIMKHDGKSRRNLLPSEYIQMAGRAGRRGKDETGTVIILCKAEVPQLNELQQIMLGKPSLLQSQFRITYSMILNLLKVRQEFAMENVLEKSFLEHKYAQRNTNLSKKKELLEFKIEELKGTRLECEVCQPCMDVFCSNLFEYKHALQNLAPIIYSKAFDSKFLGSGRLLIISGSAHPFQLAVLLEVRKKPKPGNLQDFDLTVLSLTEDENEYEYLTVKPENIFRLLNERISVEAIQIVRENVRNDEVKELTLKCVNQLREFKANYPHFTNLFDLAFIHAISDLNIRSLEYVDIIRNLDEKCALLISSGCLHCPNFVNHFNIVNRKVTYDKELNEVSKSLSSQRLQLMPEYHSKLLVLQKLGYIDNEYCLEKKGRVASLMSEHELVITEMLLEAKIKEMEPPKIAALLSAFVFQEKTSEGIAVEAQAKTEGDNSGDKNSDEDSVDDITIILGKEIEFLKETSTKIAKLQIDCGILTEPVGDFVDKLNFGLMQVVYEWAKQKTFLEIKELTDVQEGIIVRTIQRLDELLKSVKTAVKMLGELDLAKLVEDTSSAITRDIVSAASLYVRAFDNDE